MIPQNNTSSKRRKHELLANLEEKKNILEKKTIKKIMKQRAILITLPNLLAPPTKTALGEQEILLVNSFFPNGSKKSLIIT